MVIQGYFKKAVVAATFSRDGSKLCAVDCDFDHKIGVYNWQTGGTSLSLQRSPEKIVAIEWSPFQDYMVTMGVKHCMFWSTEPLKGRKAVFSKRGTIQTSLCCSFPAPIQPLWELRMDLCTCFVDTNSARMRAEFTSHTFRCRHA